MCQYYLRLVALINNHGNNYPLNDYYLSIDRNGNIKYTKPPNEGRNGYPKSIPIESICLAKALFDQHNGNDEVLSREWFIDNRPEAGSRPCNLQVMKDILMEIP